MDRGQSLLERFNTYRADKNNAQTDGDAENDDKADTAVDDTSATAGVADGDDEEEEQVTDEEIFLEQMRGYNKSMRAVKKKKKEFCGSWPVEMKASFRNSVLSLHATLTDKIKQLSDDKKKELQKKIEELYTMFQFSMGERDAPEHPIWFMPNLYKRGELIVALCGMMTMELRLQGCIKPSFGGLRSTPQNAWSELKMYKNNALRAIDTSEYGFI